MDQNKFEKTRLSDAKLMNVAGGYKGEIECPVCYKPTMQYMPSILTPDGKVYKVYVCGSCGHREEIAE